MVCKKIPAHFLHGHVKSFYLGQFHSLQPRLGMPTPNVCLYQIGGPTTTNTPVTHDLKPPLGYHVEMKNSNLLAYIGIFGNEVMGLIFFSKHQQCHVCHTMFRALYQMLYPKDAVDVLDIKDFLYLKNLAFDTVDIPLAKL